MKKYIFLFLSAALLTACQHDDDALVGDASKRCLLTLDAQVEQTVTRAGQTGVMDNTTLATTGFGVFVYDANGSTPSFMDAPQQVTYANVVDASLGDVHLHPRYWQYWKSPATGQQEWPKEATYNFFAYAPYVASPSGTTGITAVTGNASGPTISYTVATDPAQSVDLLWGVRGETGLPWLNQTRESNGGLVLFNFRHALAAIGLHVQAMIDKDNDLIDFTDVSDPNYLLGTDKLKLTLQSITITPKTNSFYGGGTLDLNNTATNTTKWTPGERNISSLTLNSTQINSSLISGGAGVLKTADTQIVIAQNGGKDQFFMLLPDAAQDYDVTVEYTVTTATQTIVYSGVNAGKATFTALPLIAGIRYWLNLVIGLKTVSVSVTAEDWQGETVNIEELTERGTSANSSLSRRTDCR